MVPQLLRSLPSYPYPPAQDGYWSPVTSTLNWCEEDYYATIYSAEIVNSVTNLLLVYLAVRGVRNCLANSHDTVFLIAFLGYGFIGLGSLAFHSSLKYPMQLWDELAMIYSACIINWAMFTWKRSRAVQIWLGVLLAGTSVFITLYYHYLQDPTFHQNAYALLVVTACTRSIWLMETRLRPAIYERERKQGTKGNTTMRTMWTMVIFGLGLLLAAFGVWTLDNKYCSWLRATRREIGLPWGILLEGHGWWHLGTGYGAYLCIVWSMWLRHCLDGDQDKYRLRWPSVPTSIPDVLKVEERSTSKKTT